MQKSTSNTTTLIVSRQLAKLGAGAALVSVLLAAFAPVSLARDTKNSAIAHPVLAQRGSTIGRPQPYRTVRSREACSVVERQEERTVKNLEVDPGRYIVKTERQGRTAVGNLQGIISKQYSFSQVRVTSACEGNRRTYRYYIDNPVHRMMQSTRFCRGGGCGPPAVTFSQWENGH